MSDIVVKLEAILNEFYNQSTSNFRKKEIELDLKTFQDCDSSWTLALSISSSNFNNQYLWFFATSTLEKTITKTWNKLDPIAKAYIRDTLWVTYSNFPTDVGAMQRDKIAQLVALIAKREPEDHGPFCQQVLHLLKSKFLLGITLLKATFGEMTSTKRDCSFQNKKHFVQGMTISLSEILPLLNKFLTLCVCRVRNKEVVFAYSDEYMDASLPNDEKFIFCCNELLVCISSIFSWSPSCESETTSELFSNIFELCMFNMSETFVSIHIAALMTISELFYLQRKLPVPEIISHGITQLLKQRDLASTAEEYQDKLCSLLKLFLTQQWTRLVNSKEFPTREFLLYLFNFTFADGISALTFAERLVIWKPIIKSFNEKEAGRYSETIVQLISNVFKKMQLQYDEQLGMLDTEDLLDTDQTENGQIQTELQFYLDTCIKIISAAAEVEPCKIFDLIHNEFNREDGNFHVFVSFLNSLPDFSIDTANIQVNLGDVLNYFSTLKPLNQPFSLNCLIRDLSTILQTITQLSSVVLLSTDERSLSISNVVRSCIFTLKLSNRKKFHLYNLNDQSVTTDLIELQAQLLNSVRSLLLLKNDIYEDHAEVFNLISSVAEVLLPSDVTKPVLVSNSAASLMLTITSQIRPQFILTHPKFIELLQSDLKNHDPHLRLSIKRIVFNSLLLPYNKIPVNQIEVQEYEKRSHLLCSYVMFISNQFLNMDGNEDDQQLILEKLKELGDYENILEAFEDANTISKQMLLAALDKVFNKAIAMFQEFGKNSIVYSKIVNFFLSVVRCLQLQLGSSFVTQIIRMILETTTISQENSEALNKLLQMLIFVVQSGSSANSLMNDILKMTLDEMLPFERSQSVDISANLYLLYSEILQKNYFQKPQALGMSLDRITNQRNHQEEILLKILNAYGEFLCHGTTGQDPNVIRIILNSLEKLQLYGLYEKVFFKNFLLKNFLICLTRLVMSECGILFCDQIVSIIFHMAEKNKSVLLESLVSIGLPEEKTVQLICESNDLPTFSSIIQNLIHDALYSQLRNI